MATLITPDLDITPQGTLVRIDQKIPDLSGSTGAAEGVFLVGGRSSTPTVTFTRPANTTPYTGGDVIGSATTANHEATNAGLAGALLQIHSVSLTVNLTSVPANMTTFRVHLWDSAPTAIADNAAFTVAAADRAKYRGYIDLPTIEAIGGGFLFRHVDYVGRPLRLAGTSFFFNLQTTNATGHTPASGTEYSVRFNCVEMGV